MIESSSSPSLSTDPSPQVLNVAAYRFAQLDDLEAHRNRLKQTCYRLQLKGTILLSSEGINLFVAGEAAAIDRLLEEIREIPGLEALEVKESFTSKQPFQRMLVKIKKEIIAFGIESIAPARHTSQKLRAAELRDWLSQGRSVRLLDVRNDYEVELGTFAGAEHLNIKHFRHFPEAVAEWTEDRDQPVVMFCTGGIRCEKAGPFMEQLGFRNIFQLDGGILKYFEECGGEHYDGDCFVFDQRVAVGPDLKPTGVIACYACQATLTEAETQAPEYEIGISCPRCYREPAMQKLEAMQEREQRLQAIARLQPGCQPHRSRRLVHVPRRLANQTLLDFLDQYQPAIGRETWLKEIQRHALVWRGEAVSPERLVQEGECYEHFQDAVVEPAVATDLLLVHEEEEWIVIDKPAPLPVHASGRYALNTLENFLSQTYAPEKVRLVHRLDANTSGLMLVSRRYRAAKELQALFVEGKVQRTYLARVHGHPSQDDFECEANIAKRPSQRGAREIDAAGQEARTRFRVLARFADGTSLLEAIPTTGRTNQIRVHLWHLNLALCGDPLYLPQHALGDRGTLEISQGPMCLHASRLVIEAGATTRTFASARECGWFQEGWYSGR